MSELNKEKIKEAIERNRKPGIYERYMNDVFAYLRDKFPGESDSTIYEAATFISNRTAIVANDLLMARDTMWRREYERKRVVERRS